MDSAKVHGIDDVQSGTSLDEIAFRSAFVDEFAVDQSVDGHFNFLAKFLPAVVVPVVHVIVTQT